MTESGPVAKGTVPSGTVTFLFSDIEGSTQRWARDRAAMQDALRLHDRLMREAIATTGGHVFKTIGDAFCAAFATPESAAQAALDAQRALAGADFSAVEGLPVRMALNTGTADERDGDYFGPALNRVARLLALAHGGQVLLSSTTAGFVRANPPAHATLADLGAHVLKDLEGHEHVYQLIGSGLQRDFPELHGHKAVGPWLVPEAMRTRYFTGRDDLLALLRQQLVERGRAVLSGLGGVGKTQTALEYATRHRDAYPGGVFWIDAETLGGLTVGFVEIARALRLSTAETNDQERAVGIVLDWLAAHDRWLLVFDNVEDRDDVRRFVPERGTGHVLITSREPVFADLGMPRAVEVGDLDCVAAVDFLLVRTGRDGSDVAERAAAADLAVEVGSLPLALEQAAAYITETNAGFSNYLAAFRKRRMALLEKAERLVSHATVAATWAANFEAVERTSPAAADVLRIGAFLAPDAIPFELLLKGARVLGDPLATAFSDPDDVTVAEVLRPLSRYSLIRSDTSTHTYSLHRLVQEVVRTSIGDSEARAYVERTVAALDAALPNVEFATWPAYQRLVIHVLAVANWVSWYDVHPPGWTRLAEQATSYLRERSRYAEAEALSLRALSTTERALGPNHPDVATLLNGLGLAAMFQGRYADAQSLQQRALNIRESVLDPDEPVVANSLNNLAMVFGHLGRYAEAIPLYERALVIWERAVGPDHRLIAIGCNNLALTYYDQGRYAEAESLYERALATYTRAVGAEHPDVAYALDGLGRVNAQLGRYEVAESFFERALALRERTLGVDDPNVGFVLRSFAESISKQGRYGAASPLLERSLSIFERLHRGDHPDVIDAVVELATLRREQGRYSEALALYERALNDLERSDALGYPDVAEIRENIAALRALT